MVILFDVLCSHAHMQAEKRELSFREFNKDQEQISKMFKSTENRIDHRRIQMIISALNDVDDLSALLELGDVKDELDTLKLLFLTQEKVITTLVNYYNIMDEESNVKHQRAISWLHDALEYVRDYSRTADGLRNRCVVVFESVCNSSSRK